VKAVPHILVLSAAPSATNPGSTWGQLGVNLGSFRGQPGSVWGQRAPPHLGHTIRSIGLMNLSIEEINGVTFGGPGCQIPGCCLVVFKTPFRPLHQVIVLRFASKDTRRVDEFRNLRRLHRRPRHRRRLLRRLRRCRIRRRVRSHCLRHRIRRRIRSHCLRICRIRRIPGAYTRPLFSSN